MTPIKNIILILAYSGLIIVNNIFCKNKSAEPEAQHTAEDSASLLTDHASSHLAHWGYADEHGPAYWASLSPEYVLCAEGKNQSPVDLSKSDIRGDAPWDLKYKTTSLQISHNEHVTDILDNGHTIQISVEKGNTLSLGEKIYHLKQFHFHTPSEHTLDGKSMPLEMHMVHQSDDGNLAVIGILFQEGKSPNENLAKIIGNLPETKGESKHVADQHLDLNLQVPKDNFAYYYSGSLTTPPCSENVQWLVFQSMVLATADQIKAISDRIGPNNRPTQALNNRAIQGVDIINTVK